MLKVLTGVFIKIVLKKGNATKLTRCITPKRTTKFNKFINRNSVLNKWGFYAPKAKLDNEENEDNLFIEYNVRKSA